MNGGAHIPLTSITAPFVCIIVLNWNGWPDTFECVASLQQLDYPNCQVLVVDNGSTDDSVDCIRSALPGIHLLETHVNLGFAGGNNVGIRHALRGDADYVLLLNNDTVVASTMLWELVKMMEADQYLAFAGPKTYYADDPRRLWFYGAAVDPQTGWAYHTPANVLDNDSYSGTRETAYCPGSALLMRVDVLRRIGALDPRFFVIHEDADWCLRARRAGYSGLVVGKAHLWHKVSASFNRSTSTPGDYYFVRNGLILSSRLSRQHRWRRVIAFAWRFGLWEPMRAIRHDRDKSWLTLLRSLTGIGAFVVGIYGPAPKWIR